MQLDKSNNYKKKNRLVSNNNINIVSLFNDLDNGINKDVYKYFNDRKEKLHKKNEIFQEKIKNKKERDKSRKDERNKLHNEEKMKIRKTKYLFRSICHNRKDLNIDEKIIDILNNYPNKSKLVDNYIRLSDLTYQGGQAQIYKLYDYDCCDIRIGKKFFDRNDLNNVVKIYEIIKNGIKKNYFSPEHPNFLKYYGRKDNFIILEYFSDSKDMYELVKYFNGLSEKSTLKYFLQILKAVKFLHNLKIAHRDIKLENLLINNNHLIKLIDFGLSTYIDSDDILSYDTYGSPNYVAPEVIFENKYNPFNSDKWSLGVLLYVMYSGDFPYNSISLNDESFLKFMSGTVNFEIEKKSSVIIKKVIKLFCKLDPKERSSIDDIIKMINNYLINDKDDLHHACSEGKILIVETMLKKGANPNQPIIINNYNTINGNTPLHFLLSNNNIIKEDIIKLILKYGGDLNIKNNEGKNPLHIAAYKGYLKNINIFFKYSKKIIDINIQDNYGVTPLHYAISGNNYEIVELLIKKNACIDIKDNNKRTPLSLAAELGNKKIIELLIKNGADSKICDSKGNNCYNFAVYSGNYDILNLLLDTKSNLNKNIKKRKINNTLVNGNVA